VALADTLKQDMNAALKARDAARLSVLRMALAAVRQHEVDRREAPTDEIVLGLIEKMIKQGREAMRQYEAAGRSELVAKEAGEIAVLESYLPARLSPEELDAMIASVIAETGAATPKDMGQVMGAMKARAAGRADMADVGARVRALLVAR
jgi:uncharacterized protein YqeY